MSEKPQAKADEVCRRAKERFPETLATLNGYLRYPAISSDPDHHGDLRRLAAKIRDDLEALGFARARLLELDDALPCVAAENLEAGPDKPCVLIYGHLDLQPVKGEVWATPPHEPVVKDGRLYARGSGDDMGGWVGHLAAIEAWLALAGALPCNVKLLIEGEEEIGSPNLERYMDAHHDAFEADVMVLTDCDNPSPEIPGLTVSLRGEVRLEVTCSALTSDVHSGLWGNVAPDVSTALVKLLARLVDDDGRLALPPVEVPATWQSAAAQMPLTPEAVRRGAHLIDGVAALPERGRPLVEWAWRQSALTVLSTTLPTPDRRKNALRRAASATLGIRIAPGRTRDAITAAVREVLLADPPGGVAVTVEALPGGSDPWLYDPQGPAFEAADRAYRKGWGHPLVHVGIGGSIPFVALFARRYGHLPLILNGVLDPLSSIHGPDESMHLGLFERAIAANVHLLAELGALGKLEHVRTL